MYLQLTTRCSLCCIHCAFSCRPGRGHDMPVNVAKKVIDACRDYGGTLTFGGGEPTLHPNLVELIEYAMEKEVDVGMTTNGTCDEELWKRLLELRGWAEQPDNCAIFVLKASISPFHKNRKPWVLEWLNEDLYDRGKPKIPVCSIKPTLDPSAFNDRDVIRVSYGISKDGRAKRRMRQIMDMPTRRMGNLLFTVNFNTGRALDTPLVDPFGVLHFTPFIPHGRTASPKRLTSALIEAIEINR